MSELRVVAERAMAAPAELGYRLIVDFDRYHPRFLPPAFSQFRVERGGVGAGTVHSFKMTAEGRARAFRMRVAEPEPGRVLTESDAGSSMATTWVVTPEGWAAGCGRRRAGGRGRWVVRAAVRAACVAAAVCRGAGAAGRLRPDRGARLRLVSPDWRRPRAG